MDSDFSDIAKEFKHSVSNSVLIDTHYQLYRLITLNWMQKVAAAKDAGATGFVLFEFANNTRFSPESGLHYNVAAKDVPGLSYDLAFLFSGPLDRDGCQDPDFFQRRSIPTVLDFCTGLAASNFKVVYRRSRRTNTNVVEFLFK